MRGGKFLAEDGRHGRREMRAEVELITAEEALGWVGETIVVHHCCHESSGEGVAGDEGDSGHWISN